MMDRLAELKGQEERLSRWMKKHTDDLSYWIYAFDLELIRAEIADLEADLDEQVPQSENHN